jgi:uncharacterized protein (DUF488 family)
MKQLNRPLYTIGYSGYSLGTFIQALQDKHVALLLDIRMTPISRKKGFSKSALHQALETAGIQYQHFRSLGSPAELRRHLADDRNYSAFFTAFRQYLHSQEQSVHQAAELVATQQVCLMCVEQCPEECHRSVVAHAIAQVLDTEVCIQHLPAPISPTKGSQKAKVAQPPPA